MEIFHRPISLTFDIKSAIIIDAGTIVLQPDLVFVVHAGTFRLSIHSEDISTQTKGHTVSSSVTLATLAKITQDRAEELALLALSSRYQTVGFDARTREVQSWCDKTALEIGEKSPDLMHFYSQFIIPHLPGSRFRGAQAMISETAVRRIALKLVYLECADFRTIVDRVTKFLTRHPNVSKSEIISLLHHYLVPHYLEKLQ